MQNAEKRQSPRAMHLTRQFCILHFAICIHTRIPSMATTIASSAAPEM
jgi:hypothetical protein